MSFESSINKPKLVDNRFIKYVNHKTKKKVLFKEEVNQKIQLENESWYNKLGKYFWDFTKDNYGFVLLTTLITLLLWVRYIEVNRKKQKIKEIITKISKENPNSDQS